MNRLRRMRTSRLLVLCGAAVLLGASATAVADSVTGGPTPPPRPLAQAVHRALAAPPVEGVSARIELTNNLIEASSLSGPAPGGGGGEAEPLLASGSGRLWVGDDGQARLELQSEQGDIEVTLDEQTLTVYEAASDALCRVRLPAGEGQQPEPQPSGVPSVARIEQAIERLAGSVDLSAAVPGDVAGRPSYSVRLSPRSEGGLIGAVELAWDAAHGVPLKAAVYSTQSAPGSGPVLELKATQISYGPVAASTFTLEPPAGTQITEVQLPAKSESRAEPQLQFQVDAPAELAGMPQTGVQTVHLGGSAGALITYGHGLGGLVVLESPASGSASPGGGLAGRLPKVAIGTSTATVLPTALGTVLSFERAGVSYVVAGSVTSATAESAARGL